MPQHLDFKVDRDELSERLGGGLPRGSLIVIEGPYGAGKSILTQRILYGLLKNHQSVGVVSTELTTLGFIEQMRSLDYTVEDRLLAGDLLYLPVYPLVAARSLPEDLLDRLRNAEELYSKEAIVIDTFSKLVTEQLRLYQRSVPATDKHADRETVSHTATGHSSTLQEPPATHERTVPPQEKLVAQVEDTLYDLKRRTSAGKTILLTVEPDQLPAPVLQLLRDTSDVHLALEFDLVGNNASRRVVVKRFSRAKGRLGDVIGYRVEPGVGLVIEIKSVA